MKTFIFLYEKENCKKHKDLKAAFCLLCMTLSWNFVFGLIFVKNSADGTTDSKFVAKQMIMVLEIVVAVK